MTTNTLSPFAQQMRNETMHRKAMHVTTDLESLLDSVGRVNLLDQPDATMTKVMQAYNALKAAREAADFLSTLTATFTR